MNGFSNNLSSYTRNIYSGIKEVKHLSLSRLWKVFSLMGKKERIAILVLLVTGALSFFVSVKNFYYNHTSAAAAAGGIYSEGLLSQPTYINPLLANAEPDLSLVNLIFSGLYKYGPDGQLTPDIADGLPQISSDQKQYTINLKHNVQWHNGKNLTADDVVFTIQTLQDPSYKSPLRPLWQSTTVSKLSDYSVKFTTKDVSGPFLQNLIVPILPKGTWGNVSPQNFLLSKYNLEAVGSGPYAIKEIKKLPSGKVQQISLDSYDNYYQGRAKIDTIIFKFYDSEEDELNAFHSREIQGFGFIPLSSNLFLDKNQQDAQVVSIPLPQYQVVFFNLKNKILTNVDVRTALSLSTDKQEIIDQVFKNNALLPSSPLLFGSQQNPAAPAAAVDIEKAKTLLDKAGWTVDAKTGVRADKKGNAFQITITTNDSLTNSKAAEILANQWRKLNIKINLSILPAKQLTDSTIRPRSFDVLLFPEKFGADPDPFLFWHSSQVKDPGFNLTGFVNPTADNLIIDARTTTDKKTREADYQQFNDLITSQVPVIFLDQTEYLYAIDSGIKNITLKTLYDPSQRFYDVVNWYMAESRIWK